MIVMRGLEFLPTEGRPPCEFPEVEPIPRFFRPARGRLTPRPSSRRSTSDKTGQGTREMWRRVLIKKYGRICHICLAAGITDTRATIDLDLKYPEPLSFTRDHIKPRSQGGRDTRVNQRPAHKICNERRGNRPMTAEAAAGWSWVTYRVAPSEAPAL